MANQFFERTLWVSAVALLLSTAQFASAAGEFVFLDTLEESYIPTDVSADGSVVVGIIPGGLDAYETIPDGPQILGQYFTYTASEGTVNIGGIAPGNSTGTPPKVSGDGNRVSGLMFNPDHQVELQTLGYTDELVPVAEMSYYDRTTQQWINLGYGDLSAASIKTTSNARGISGNGQHVLGRAYIGGGGQRHTEVVVWNDDGSGQLTPGSVVELDIPDEVRDGVLVNPNAISDDGGTIVGTISSSHTFIWKDDELKGVFNTYNQPNAVSGDGNVVVGDNYRGTAGDFNGDYTVDLADYTVWRNNLGAPAGTIENNIDPGPIDQDAYDTWRANLGEGGSSTSGTYEAWRWTEEGGVEPLGCFSGNCGVGAVTTKIRGYAVDTNYDGSLIIGYDSSNTPGIDTPAAWIWQEGVGQMGLKDYFLAEGLVLTGFDENFEFSLPSAISADGRTFVGMGYDPDDIDTFGQVGWIVRLPPLGSVSAVTVPEPGSIALALLGLAVLAGRKSWQR